MDKKTLKNFLITEVSSKFWDLNIKRNYSFYIFIVFFFLLLKALYFFLVDYLQIENMSENVTLLLFMSTIILSSNDSLNSTGKAVEEERKQGTLEQIYLSPIPFHLILLTRNMVSILSKPLMILIIMQLFIWTNGINLKFNYFSFIYLTIISIFPLLGIGYILAGVTLIYKGFYQLSSIIIFFIMGGMILPVYPFNFLSLIPFFPQVYTLRLNFVEGQVFSALWYSYLLLNSLVYFLVGVVIFRRLEKKSKTKDVFFRRY